MLFKRALRYIEKEEVKSKAIQFERQLDLRYLGQSYEPLMDVKASFNGDALLSGIEAFHRRHREIYGYAAIDPESMQVMKDDTERLRKQRGAKPPSDATF